jgi:glucose-6-phosphate isomerase
MNSSSIIYFILSTDPISREQIHQGRQLALVYASLNNNSNKSEENKHNDNHQKPNILINHRKLSETENLTICNLAKLICTFQNRLFKLFQYI